MCVVPTAPSAGVLKKEMNESDLAEWEAAAKIARACGRTVHVFPEAIDKLTGEIRRLWRERDSAKQVRSRPMKIHRSWRNHEKNFSSVRNFSFVQWLPPG